jgi:hypothetical protein
VLAVSIEPCEVVPLIAGTTVLTGAGGGTLTVQARVSGDWSGLPDGSIARTEKVWPEFARPLYDVGEVHDENPAPSRLHWNDEPGSVDVNVNVADAVVTVPVGPVLVIVVSGGVVSVGGTFTVQVAVAGEGSAFPAASVARTVKVCGPFVSEV